MFFRIFLILLAATSFAKLRILTFHYNQPDFIEWQHKCAEKFLLDDYEMIVFNDAATPENELAIQEICSKLNISCIRFQPEWHLIAPLNRELYEWAKDPTIIGRRFLPSSPSDTAFANQASVRHSHVIQYALDNYGYDHDDDVVILDGDAFFIREISIKKRLETLDIFGMGRNTIEGKQSYLWVPFVAFNPKKLPNLTDLKFNVAPIDQIMHDTGAQSQRYLEENPTVKYKRTLPVKSGSLRQYTDYELKLLGFSKHERWLIQNLPKHQGIEFNIDGAVLHFREVSFQMPGHDKKVALLEDFMCRILK